MGWTEYRRTDTMRGQREEFISLRPMGIAFSTGFVQANGLGEMTRVSLVFDHKAQRLGFRFHTTETNLDAFAVTADGSSSEGRYLNSKRIYADFPWLAAVLKRPTNERRFRPSFSKGVWFIDVKSGGQ